MFSCLTCGNTNESAYCPVCDKKENKKICNNCDDRTSKKYCNFKNYCSSKIFNLHKEVISYWKNKQNKECCRNCSNQKEGMCLLGDELNDSFPCEMTGKCEDWLRSLTNEKI